MKLWQKNHQVNKAIEIFTVGRDRELDLELALFDVIGSMAHIRMLLEIGLLNTEEYNELHTGLKAILSEISQGKFRIEDDVEDIHSQIEILLTRKLGDAGKKIHSGRSRNDQVLLDIKLYMRSQIQEISKLTEMLFNRLIILSDQYREVLMPGYTHFQVAMPSSFGLWFGAYAESLCDDMIFLKAALDIINRNPLGSAAGYGSSFPLNRQLTTDLLGFESMNYNVVYAQMGRGRAEKSMAIALGSIADTLGKFSMDICLYMSQNYRFLSFPDEYTTGSSIMPHKKNPDVFEIIRGRCNQIKSFNYEISLISANLPSGYHREMQILKEGLIKHIESIKDCLYMADFMLDKIIINENILDDDKYDYMFSVEKVNELVLKGKSFRDAYREVGKMIEEGTFSPDKIIRHTHEGSIGKLCNDKIRNMMKIHMDYFESRFENIEKNISRLINAK